MFASDLILGLLHKAHHPGLMPTAFLLFCLEKNGVSEVLGIPFVKETLKGHFSTSLPKEKNSWSCIQLIVSSGFRKR